VDPVIVVELRSAMCHNNPLTRHSRRERSSIAGGIGF
jgi:hypothetical protein